MGFEPRWATSADFGLSQAEQLPGSAMAPC